MNTDTGTRPQRTLRSVGCEHGIRSGGFGGGRFARLRRLRQAPAGAAVIDASDDDPGAAPSFSPPRGSGVTELSNCRWRGDSRLWQLGQCRARRLAVTFSAQHRWSVSWHPLPFQAVRRRSIPQLSSKSSRPIRTAAVCDHELVRVGHCPRWLGQQNTDEMPLSEASCATNRWACSNSNGVTSCRATMTRAPSASYPTVARRIHAAGAVQACEAG